MTRSLKRATPKLFTPRQTAAILRLYVQQRLPALETAERLRFNASRVVRFLRQRGVMRPAGNPGTPRKLFPPIRQKLERELPTTPSSMLARKYGVSRERIRQIREEVGAPSGREVQRQWAAKARQQRREQRQLENRRRREERLAQKLIAINHLSARWKSGAKMRELAAEKRTTPATIATLIQRLRRSFPEKFPFRAPWGTRLRRSLSRNPKGQKAARRRSPQSASEGPAAVNQLSAHWRAGSSIDELAQELGVSHTAVIVRIQRLRRVYPEKFACRVRPRKAGVRLI